jgi:hypothetical protein
MAAALLPDLVRLLEVGSDMASKGEFLRMEG